MHNEQSLEDIGHDCLSSIKFRKSQMAKQSFEYRRILAGKMWHLWWLRSYGVTTTTSTTTTKIKNILCRSQFHWCGHVCSMFDKKIRNQQPTVLTLNKTFEPVNEIALHKN